MKYLPQPDKNRWVDFRESNLSVEEITIVLSHILSKPVENKVFIRAFRKAMAESFKKLGEERLKTLEEWLK